MSMFIFEAIALHMECADLNSNCKALTTIIGIALHMECADLNSMEENARDALRKSHSIRSARI